jgi:exodeoxyribonuclease VII large subunit
VADAQRVEETVLEVAQFYEVITAHLESGFGRRHPCWVRGEVAKVYEKTHLYLDLVDAGSAPDTRRPVLNAHCWATQWNPLKRKLAEDGLVLKPGAIISVHGYVDLYAPQGRLGFTVTAIDVEGLLGDVARRRQELIARLGAEGLLERNKSMPLSPVPLRIGLIASPGTEGYSDFTGQLLASRYGFEVTLVATAVQGEAAPAQIVRALEELGRTPVDVICLVRGGGSKGDLACFDDEGVARAIADAPVPVFTGIGHTGDVSIADLVAHASAITPTKLGEHVVNIVAEWDRVHVRQPALRLHRALEAILEEATEYVAERRRTMIFAVRDRLRAERRHLGALRERLGLQADHVLGDATQSLSSTRRLLGAYDPQRRLAQGWSIVTDERGRVVRSRTEVAPGERLAVRVRDGVIGVEVLEKETP